jgi:hypothetical protein
MIFLHNHAQKRTFDLILSGKSIGYLDAERKVGANGIEMYTLFSKASSKILWKNIDAETRFTVTFVNGELVDSYYEHKENGMVEKYCKISKSASGKYQVHHHKNGKFEAPSGADYGLLHVYFKEPSSRQKMLNEAWGEYTDFKSIKPNTYEYKTPDGSRNVYVYNNGKLEFGKFHTSIAPVKLKPKF